jgi:hypothetical protein
VNTSNPDQVLTYCKIDYPTCVDNFTLSEMQARDYAEKLLFFVDSDSCKDARKNYACSLFFPKCIQNTDPNEPNPPQLPPCKATCLRWLDTCDFTSPECNVYVLIGPDPNCTSGASLLNLSIFSLVVLSILFFFSF